MWRLFGLEDTFLEEFNKIQKTCFALAALVDMIQQKLAAIEVLQNSKKYTEANEFLECLLHCVNLRCIAEIHQIFDRPHFRDKDICTIRLLKEQCLLEENSHYFLQDQANELAQKLESLQQEYEKVSPREIRNQQIAHHDFKRMFEDKVSFVSFTSLFELTQNTSNTIGEIMVIVTGTNMLDEFYPSYSEYIHIYSQSAQHLICSLARTMEDWIKES